MGQSDESRRAAAHKLLGGEGMARGGVPHGRKPRGMHASFGQKGLATPKHRPVLPKLPTTAALPPIDTSAPPPMAGPGAGGAGPMPMGMPPQQPPMKRGGRVGYAKGGFVAEENREGASGKFDAGAGSGEGRIEKAAYQRAHPGPKGK